MNIEHNNMETTPIGRLLLKLSPPVMLSLLIQSIYNIVDSFFVARYSAEGLTALSLICPIQFLMIALATGTGAGVNIIISRLDGLGETTKQQNYIRTGLILALVNFIIFAIPVNCLTGSYFHIFSENVVVRRQGILYTHIILAGALGLFIESICTKILQARSNMVVPMIAQVTGSIINVILDPLLIFGMAFFPKLGIAGAAIATVIGQWAAMFITLTAVLKKYSIRGHFSFLAVRRIYQNGIGSIVTQSLCTLYIVGLNMILKDFTEDAVTVLGLYYKIQSFFFIPLLGFQQVLLPVISYNYGAGKIKRTRDALKFASFLSCGIMTAATLIFILFPDKLLGIFSTEASILSIGCFAFRVISLSFVPAGLTIAITSYLQGVARMKESVFIIVLRQVFLLVPLAWILHFFGLSAVWWTFPLTEIIASLWCVVLVTVKDKTQTV